MIHINARSRPNLPLPIAQPRFLPFGKSDIAVSLIGIDNEHDFSDVPLFNEKGLRTDAVAQ